MDDRSGSMSNDYQQESIRIKKQTKSWCLCLFACLPNCLPTFSLVCLIACLCSCWGWLTSWLAKSLISIADWIDFLTDFDFLSAWFIVWVRGVFHGTSDPERTATTWRRIQPIFWVIWPYLLNAKGQKPNPKRAKKNWPKPEIIKILIRRGVFGRVLGASTNRGAFLRF